MSEKERLKPISIATLQMADAKTECPSDTEVASLITSLNDSIQSNAVSPRSCLTFNGLTTWKAARVDVRSFSKASVIQAVEVFQNAGYFAIAFGEPKQMETLWVSWDAALGAKEKTSTPAKVSSVVDSGGYVPSCRDIVRVAGLKDKIQTAWNRKCCVAYVAAACLLAEEYAARHPSRATTTVIIKFPGDVPATAISAAIRELSVRFYHAYLDPEDSRVMCMECSPALRMKRFSGRAGFSVGAFPLTDMLKEGGVSPDKVLDERES